jgi:hypothetical protein
MNESPKNEPWIPLAARPVMGGSVLADRQAAIQAVEMLMPMFASALHDDTVGRSGCMHVVIMDPALTPADASFDEAILYEFSLPDPREWDADYGGFARAKARLSWLTGMSSQLVQTSQPHRLRSGNTTLWGSVVHEGIVVGVSGANPWFDEAFAGCVAHCLKAIAQHRAHAAQERLFL